METIAQGFLSGRRGEPQSANPHAMDFWRRHWARGWEIAGQGNRLGFSLLREKPAIAVSDEMSKGDPRDIETAMRIIRDPEQ